MRNFLDEINTRVLIYDGSKGYMLQQMGLSGGECPELWNVKHPENVSKIHQMYKSAGADVIQTNTFQGNRVQLGLHSLADRTYELNYEGALLAKNIMGDDGFVAGSVGPTGKLFEPSGDLNFEMAYDIFKEQVQALVDGGVDIINFETFTDLAEMRVALFAAKAVANIPVICSLSFEENGRTLMGTDPFNAAIVLSSLGADMVGTNCSFGAEQQLGIIKLMSKAGGAYLSAKPNAGLPEVNEGVVCYNETPENFAKIARKFIKYGVRLIGGCCGTTPDFIKEIVEEMKTQELENVKNTVDHVISSDTKLIDLTAGSDLSILHFFKDTSEKEREEIAACDEDVLIERALDFAAEGPDAVCFDTYDLPNSKDGLARIISVVQSYLRAPFIFMARDYLELEKALKIYKGKAGIIVTDSLEGQQREHILRVVDQYGATVLTNDFIRK